jgi:hypothetical protein
MSNNNKDKDNDKKSKPNPNPMVQKYWLELNKNGKFILFIKNYKHKLLFKIIITISSSSSLSS